MTEAAKKILQEYRTLSEEERREVALEILRCAPLSDDDFLTDDDLIAIADDLFTQLDREEQER